MITIQSSGDPKFEELIQNHPRFDYREGLPDRIEFDSRMILLSGDPVEPFGLIELMDNNPLVCANVASLPPSDATLMLMALGPMFRAGLPIEPPVFRTTAPKSSSSLTKWLDTPNEIPVDYESVEPSDWLFGHAICLVKNVVDWREIDNLYADSYDRTFYVSVVPDIRTEVKKNQFSPNGFVQLTMTPGEDESLISIHVAGHKNGKCGACQKLQMLNIMCGLEEFLGIPSGL